MPPAKPPAVTETLPLDKYGGQEIVRRRVDEIKLDPENVRLHDERDIAFLAGSLAEHGQVEPLLVRKGTLKLIGGEGRIIAMRRLGWDQCNVVELVLSDLKAKELALKLNRAGELSTWSAGLADVIAALGESGIETESLGYTRDEVDALFADSGDESKVTLKPVRVKPPPNMVWVVVGMPAARYGEIDKMVRNLSAVPDIICEVSTSAREKLY